MKKLFILFCLLNFGGKIAQASTKQKINIYYDRDIVCISSTNECWSFAKGKSAYPTPTWEGPRPLLVHIKNGFNWRNPLTGQVFKKGTHALGNIWIEFYTDPSTGWRFGFHQTPYPNIPLSQQESHGCLRMTLEDLLDFSSKINYYDEFYIIRDEVSSNYLYNNLLDHKNLNGNINKLYYI